MPLLIPARRATPEYLDDPATDVHALATSGVDISRCNRLFGGTAAFLAELAPLWPTVGATATLLDIGCGVGDLGDAARAHAERAGVALTVLALDKRALFAAAAAPRADAAVVADAFALPFADASIDVVTGCQFLHHFSDAEITRLAHEMTRVARRRVIISDLRRSWVSAAGLWLASWPLRFHPITRHDGVASVLKGFVPHDLRATLSCATGCQVSVARRAAFRITASWSPTH